MFWWRGGAGAGEVRVDVAFTDGSLDLHGARADLGGRLAALEAACGVGLAVLEQVHGQTVVVVDRPTPAADDALPRADAMVTATPGVGLLVRAADCVPVLLADPVAGVVGAAHAGRGGLVHGVVTRAVEAVAEQGGDPGRTVAWVGPRVCGSCYEVPEQMREEVSQVSAQAWSTTSWGTPALDLAAGVRAQLAGAGVAEVHDVPACTREEPRLPSFRRDGDAAGRLGGLVWLS